MALTQKRVLTKLVFALLFIILLAWAMWMTPVVDANLPAKNPSMSTAVPTPDKNSEQTNEAPGAWLDLQITGTFLNA